MTSPHIPNQLRTPTHTEEGSLPESPLRPPASFDAGARSVSRPDPAGSSDQLIDSAPDGSMQWGQPTSLGALIGQLPGGDFPAGEVTFVVLEPEAFDPVPALVTHHLSRSDAARVRYCMPGYASVIYATDLLLQDLAGEHSDRLELLGVARDGDADPIFDLSGFGRDCPATALLLIDMLESVDEQPAAVGASLRALAAARPHGPTVVVVSSGNHHVDHVPIPADTLVVMIGDACEGGTSRVAAARAGLNQVELTGLWASGGPFSPERGEASA